MRYGYDSRTGSLFGWDGEFHYLGETLEPPGGDIVLWPKDYPDALAGFVGGCFFSGFKNPVQVWSDGKKSTYAYSKSCAEHHFLKKAPNVEAVRHIVISGPIIRQPKQMAKLCVQFPYVSAFACTLSDGVLRAFSALVMALDEKERPRRANLYEPNDDALSGRESIDYNPDLGEGDALGRMANMLFLGTSVVNQIRKPVGLSTFYGNLLLSKEKLGGETYIIRAEKVSDFTLGCFSATFVSQHVPVEMTVTDEFRKVTEIERQSVPIVVASDNVVGLGTFMNFYHAFSGESFVCVMGIKGDTPQNFSVYRYNRWYRHSELEKT